MGFVERLGSALKVFNNEDTKNDIHTKNLGNDTPIFTPTYISHQKVKADISKGTAQRCVSLIGTALGDIEYYIEVNGERVDDHWYYEVMDSPNRFNPSWQAFINQFTASYLAYGNTLYQTIDKELIYLDWSYVEPKINNGLITRYAYRENGSIYYISPEDAIHIKDLSIGSFAKTSLYGVASRYKAAEEYIKAEAKLIAYTDSEFDTGGVVPTLITTQTGEARPEKKTMESLKATLRNIYGGEHQSIFAEGAKIENFSKNNELIKGGFKEGISKALSQNIATQFGVPYIILNGDFNIGKDNARTVVNFFYGNTITPLANTFCEYMSEWIRSVDRRRDIKLTFTPPIYQDAEDVRESQRFEWEAEDRERMLSNPTENVERSIKKKSTENIDDWWQRKNSFLDEGIKELEKPLKIWFDELEDVILDRVDETLKNADHLTETKILGALFDRIYKRLVELASPVLSKFVISVISNIDEIADEPTVYSNEAEASVRESLELMKKPVETIDKEIDRLIKETILESPDDLKARIKEKIKGKFSDVYTESRIDLIATQSATVAKNSATRKVYQKRGWKMQWVSQRDKRVRPSHKKLDGTIIEPDGVFQIEGVTVNDDGTEDTVTHNGLYPGDPDLPPEESMRCRCDIKAVR